MKKTENSSSTQEFIIFPLPIEETLEIEFFIISAFSIRDIFGRLWNITPMTGIICRLTSLLTKTLSSQFFNRITLKKMERNSTNNNKDDYQEVKLVRIREYKLPVLKRAVVIYVQNDGNVAELHKDPEVFFGHSMDRDNNTELSETKSLEHQNKFQHEPMRQVEGQVVDSKISKMRPQSKYQILNKIETAPIKLEKVCMSLEKKEYPMTFAEELKELHHVKMLNGLPTVEKKEYTTFVDELKELHHARILNDLPTIVPTVEKKGYPTFVDELKELNRVSKLNELGNLSLHN